jgi:hypothetical protein
MRIKVGIHVHMRGKIGPFSEKYIKILDHNNIQYVIMDINSTSFWEELKSVSHFIFNWGGFPDHHQIAKSIMPVIEYSYNLPVFPNIKTTWQQDDKIRQYYLLKKNDFPVIDTNIFWDKLVALNWIRDKAKYPQIFKLKSSAGSQDVVLVRNVKDAKKLTNRMFGKGIMLNKIPGNWRFRLRNSSINKIVDRVLKIVYRTYKGRDTNYYWKREKNYVFFQKFLPKNDFDTRITIIGNRAFAFRRFNRENDFRSSGSGLINYNMDMIDKRFLNIAFQISSKMEFQSMAYDFLYDEFNEPALCEISYTYQDLAVYNCPGYWDNQLNWHEGNIWPQLSHLQDLLRDLHMEYPH